MSYGIGRAIPVYSYSSKSNRSAGSSSSALEVRDQSKYVTLPIGLTERCTIEASIAATEWLSDKDADYKLAIHDDGGTALSTPFEIEFTVGHDLALESIDKAVTVSAELETMARTNALTGQIWHAHLNASNIYVRTFAVRIIARVP